VEQLEQTPIRDLTSVADILKQARAAELIAEAKGGATRGVSGEEFLGAADKLFPGAKIGGAIGQALGKKMGLKAQAEQTAQLPGAPYAYGVLALMCAAARASLETAEIAEPEPGVCVLHARTPSTIWAFGGEAVFTVRADPAGAAIEAMTVHAGQVFDWGRGKRLLAEVLDDAAARARTYATLGL